MRRVSSMAAALMLAAMLALPHLAHAQATDPFLGQLMLVGFNFCPNGWQPAAGQILPITQNTALFALLGTLYGGNGQTTFALPDLRGRVPNSQGQGPGLSDYVPGQTGGAESHTVVIAEMPAHAHQAFGSSALASALAPTNGEVAGQDRVRMYGPSGSETPMSPNAIGITGGSLPFDIRSPFLTLQWCIAVQGVFPSRP